MFASVSCCGIIRKRKDNIYDTSGENNHIEKTIHETGTVIDDGVHEILRIYWLVLEQQKEEDILYIHKDCTQSNCSQLNYLYYNYI